MITFIDAASPEDPNELNFNKDDVLDIVDNKGKWWQARRADGVIGIVPSNYVCKKWTVRFRMLINAYRDNIF